MSFSSWCWCSFVSTLKVWDHRVSVNAMVQLSNAMQWRFYGRAGAIWPLEFRLVSMLPPLPFRIYANCMAQLITIYNNFITQICTPAHLQLLTSFHELTGKSMPCFPNSFFMNIYFGLECLHLHCTQFVWLLKAVSRKVCSIRYRKKNSES